VLKLIIPHVFLGVFLMVPLDLFLAYTVWAITRKRIFSLYFLVYGLLTMPTTIWGNTPGIFKPLLGIVIGLCLDLIAFRLQPDSRMVKTVMAVLFPVVYWSLTGAMWVLAGLPIVTIFQGMLMSVPALRPIAAQGFFATFIMIALMTMPSSVVATYGAVSLSKNVGRIVTIPQARTAKEEIHHG